MCGEILCHTNSHCTHKTFKWCPWTQLSGKILLVISAMSISLLNTDKTPRKSTNKKSFSSSNEKFSWNFTEEKNQIEKNFTSFNKFCFKSKISLQHYQLYGDNGSTMLKATFYKEKATSYLFSQVKCCLWDDDVQHNESSSWNWI